MRTLLSPRPGPIGRAAAAALLVLMLGGWWASAGHVHQGGAEAPQACAVCHAGHLPVRDAPPALVAPPPPAVGVPAAAAAPTRPLFAPRPSPRHARAPPV